MLLHKPDFDYDEPQGSRGTDRTDRLLRAAFRAGLTIFVDLLVVLRKSTHVPIFVLGGLILFVAALSLGRFDESGLDDTIAKNRQIQARFDRAHAFVQDWQAIHQRLPTVEEFHNWATDDMDYVTAWFPEEVIAEFGEPPPSAYFLSIWRGEWYEYAPSWSTRSTLLFEKSEFFILGSPGADFAMFAGVGVALLCLAAVVRRRGVRGEQSWANGQGGARYGLGRGGPVG